MPDARCQQEVGVRIPGALPASPALPQATMSEGLRPSSRVLPVVRRYLSDVRLTGIEFDGISMHGIPWPTAKVQRSLGQRPRYGCPHQNQDVSPLALSLLGERGGGEGGELCESPDTGCQMIDEFVAVATFEGRRGFQPTALRCTNYVVPDARCT